MLQGLVVPSREPQRNRTDDVLDVATAILLEKGYAGLSFRSVAERAGMGLGNLQHYFPTKDDLISAMLERAFEDFAHAMARRPEQAQRGGDGVIAALRYVLKDQKKRRSCVIFWELWALAAHDRPAAEIMSKFYRRYVDLVASLIQQERPDVTAIRARRAGTVIAALVEGASLFRGHGRPAEQLPAGFDRALEQTILKIAADA